MVNLRSTAALAALTLALSIPAATPALAQQDLGSIFRSLAPTQGQTPQQQQPQQTQPPVQPGVQSREWLGYALRFQDVRTPLESGDFAAARTLFESAPATASAEEAEEGEGSSRRRTPRSMADRAGPFLRGVELGTMQFDSGDLAAARISFDAVGQAQGTDADGGERRSWRQRLGGVVGRGAQLFGGLVGNGELARYEAPEYERVLQLNYLALTYLMAGDAAAFNVSRRQGERQLDAFESLNDRAARLQDEARAAFEQERAEAEARLAEARGDAAQGAAADSVAQQMQAVYATEDHCTAPNLPSAFVNPLGFYLSGVVYDVSSVQFREDRDTARIAYEKALLLAPRSPVLQSAVRELNGATTPQGRLVHLMVAEGFAPTRQVVRTNLQINTDVVPLNIPRLSCHASPVARVELRTPRGQVLSRLDPIADIEGMMLQRQRDREGLTTLSVILNGVRGALENRWGQQNAFAGMFVQLKQQNFDRPDMRSWSTLPARIHVARTYVPQTLTEVQVVSLDARGRVLASRTMPLDTTSRQNVLYARAAGQTLTAAPTAQLWISGM